MCLGTLSDMVWLGTVIDTANSTIAATDKRIESLLCDLNDILRDSRLSVHVKKIGNVTRFMSRNLYSLINSASAWSDYVQLNGEAVIELKFWQENL